MRRGRPIERPSYRHVLEAEAEVVHKAVCQPLKHRKMTFAAFCMGLQQVATKRAHRSASCP